MATWKTYPDFAGGGDYYYNTDTGVSSWTRPADLPPLEPSTYVPLLSAGSRAPRHREGGGSKELEGGSGTDSDEEPQEPHYEAAALCKTRKQPVAVAASAVSSKSAETNETPLVWVPVPAPKPNTGKKTQSAKRSAGTSLATWSKPSETATQDATEGVWRYHQYDVGEGDAKVTAVAKWVVRNAGDQPREYKNQQGVTVNHTEDLQPVTLAALVNTTQDLTQLDSLEEPLIVFQLQQRFVQRHIYTDIGPIVVSINPLVQLPTGEAEKSKAQADAANERKRFREGKERSSPHVYNTAEKVYTVAKTGNAQAIIISGESGSGKTFATKMMLQYIMERANGTAPDKDNVAARIQHTNPVLEAFGNAKTRNNDNSSRFGKYLQVFLDEAGDQIVGAKTDAYLLEKVRVVKKDRSERNYHIFYMLLAGLEDAALERLRLERKPKKQYRYLDTTADIGSWDDAQLFNELREALDTVGINHESVFAVLAAIIHFGEVDITEDAHGHAVISTTDEHLITAAVLLSGSDGTVTPGALVKCICEVTSKTKDGTPTRRPLPKAQNALDTLAKYLYGYVFEYLVRRLNEYTEPKGAGRVKTTGTYIGFLDIFGFEKMATNSLEQLCINYANEKLQQLFNDTTFGAEMGVYEAEKINVGTLSEKTEAQNANMKAIRDVKGLLAVLEEKVKVTRASDEGTCDDGTAFKAIKSKFQTDRKNAAVTFNDIADDSLPFFVQHYAAKIKYTTQGICAKSKDELDSDIANAVRTGSKFVQELVPEPSVTADKTTVGLKFVKDVESLIDVLKKADQHYVRCVKSNVGNEQWKFDAATCYTQLKYAGVFQALQLQVLGFPIHTPFADFVTNYAVILDEDVRPEGLEESSVRAPLDAFKEATTAAAKAPAIRDYVLASSAQLRSNAKDAERIRAGQTKMLYCGTWRRALETLREPAQKRFTLRETIMELAEIDLDDDARSKLSLAVLEARRQQPPLFTAVDDTMKNATANLQKHANSKLTPEVRNQLTQAMKKLETHGLAQLVGSCIKQGLVEVDIVEQAYDLLCRLVALEENLDRAVTDKNETQLTTAIGEAAAFTCEPPADGREAKTCPYSGPKLDGARVCLAAIQEVAKQAQQACMDGIKAHGGAVVNAATGVVFAAETATQDVELLRNMTPASRRQKTLEAGNFDEAVRIQIEIEQATSPGAPEQLLESYLEGADVAVEPKRFPERRVLEEGDDQPPPPFTNLARGASNFQARLLDQAAVDNFDVVKHFVADPSTVSVEKLDELFTSCFMHECLRDELFIAVYKTAPDLAGFRSAVILLHLALGHFGPSERLTHFVKAFLRTAKTDEGAGDDPRLLELCIRREIWGEAGNLPWEPVAGADVKYVLVAKCFLWKVITDASDRIRATFQRFNDPDYSKEEWFGLLAKATETLQGTPGGAGSSNSN